MTRLEVEDGIADSGRSEREIAVVPDGSTEPRGPMGFEEASVDVLAARCGSDVIRIADEWSSVVAALLGGGWTSVRVRHSFGAAQLDAVGLPATIEEGRLRLGGGEQSTIQSELGVWRTAYLEVGAGGPAATLYVFDAVGWPAVEFTLDGAQLGRLADFLPALEHPCQLPHAPPRQAAPRPAIRHRSLNGDWLATEWAKPSTYAAIDELCEVLRIGRASLFEVLEADRAVSIRPRRLQLLVDAAAHFGLPVECEMHAPPTAVALEGPVERTDGADTTCRIDGRRLHVEVERAHDIYAVRKPTVHGLRTGIEVFDRSGRRQIRLRLASGAASDQRTVWRSCLPFSRLGG